MVVRSHSDPPFMPGPCKSFLEPPWALGGATLKLVCSRRPWERRRETQMEPSHPR